MFTLFVENIITIYYNLYPYLFLISFPPFGRVRVGIPFPPFGRVRVGIPFPPFGRVRVGIPFPPFGRVRVGLNCLSRTNG
jgi:hypothetical protein